MPRPLQPCGTEAAYRRHIAHGKEPCEPCRQAHNDHGKQYRPAPTRFDRPPCGTVKGYYSHRRHGEERCQACKDAIAAERRTRYGHAAPTTTSRVLAPCGTDAAHKRHLQRGEEPCAACKAAHSRLTNADNKAKRIVAKMQRERAA